ncbi:MAG: hypothetical protein D9V44_08060 [Actinobacteria bacterium]|nr:MAG: hypothetical protein D9V44_08060 [Actinomycetota bacterium]
MSALHRRAALAYWEPSAAPATTGSCSCHGSDVPNSSDLTVRLTCQHCHGYTSDQFPLASRDSVDVQRGPHGYYSATTRKCESCHTLHDAPEAGLLPASSVVDTCWVCHDGTGGYGVYGTIKARGAGDPATDLSLGSHRIQATAVVPGGDAESGGSSTRVFSGPADTLICSDCHSVHGQNLVAGFMGERRRTRSYERQDRPTAKLLRRLPRTLPSSVTTLVAEYGSDWCASCHEGRVSGMTALNHPVDSLATTTSPFFFRRLAGGRTLAYGGSLTPPQTSRHTRSDRYDFGLGNYDFLMTFPRNVGQGSHAPICQQCHEDARKVGSLSADGLSAIASPTVLAAADGMSAGDNPRFQNFPHETQNNYLLVESNDDLCLNCHPSQQLP